MIDGRKLNTDEIITKILEQRNINYEDVMNFVYDEKKYRFDDTDIKALYEAVTNSKRIGIVFDVDTDGVTSGTIMYKYLNSVGIKTIPLICKEKIHGTGGIDMAKLSEFQVLIIVDSLDNNSDNYAELVKSGVKLFVLDHHDINSDIDYSMITLISSQKNYPNPHLSGAGVCYKVCKQLDELFKVDNADDYIDLASVGILADVSDVSLASVENRSIVYNGLNNLHSNALRLMIDKYEFNSKSVLFSIAPMINACTRMNMCDVAMKFFIEEDINRQKTYLAQMKNIREAQQKEVDKVLSTAKIDMCKNIVFVNIDTKYGISGLIANRMISKFCKPAIVFKDKCGKFVGSMRSVGVGDFKELCNSTKLAKADGHAEASGIEIAKDDFDIFVSTIDGVLEGIKPSVEPVEADCLIDVYQITEDLVRQIKAINFVSGKNFSPITFKIIADDYDIRTMKDGKHLVCTTKGAEIIEWNSDNIESMETNSLLNIECSFVGEIDFAYSFSQKRKVPQLFVNEIREV